MTRARSSFRSLLRAWIFGFTLLAVVLSGIFFVGYANNEINHHLRLMEDMIQLYSDDTISIEFGRGNSVYVRDAIGRLAHLLNAKKARILGPDGVIVESTEASEIGLKAGRDSSSSTVLSARIREHSSGEQLGRLEVYVNRRALFGDALRAGLLPAVNLLLGLLLLAIFVTRSLRRRLIRPISQVLTSSEVPETERRQWPTEICDLSERFQEALQERDFAMIGQFSSGILHDIKTKIHSVNSAKELIDEVPVDSPKRASRLEGLYRACAVHIPPIRALIEATLDGSRQIHIEPTARDLGGTLVATIEQYHDYAVKRGVRLEVTDGINKLLVAHDGAQLERALSNILKNGIECFDKTDIFLKKVQISARGEGDSIEICIEDSGPGLTLAPHAILQSIRTTKAHGTGLGLLIARKIIEAHGGRLSAGASERLSGARFSVSLPTRGVL